jgi:hypothetical protein
VSERLDDLARTFFATVGLVESGGYQVTEVLLHDRVREHFGGRDYLRFTPSREVAREDAQAEVLTFGSTLLEAMTRAAVALGQTGHFYLEGVNLTTGRTLEKVRQHTRIPGHVLEAGVEEPYLHHHAVFRFKVALVAEAREESFENVAVDLHSGWVTTALEKAALEVHGPPKSEVLPETAVVLTLSDACRLALEARRGAIASRVRERQLSLRPAATEERSQITDHYQTIIWRLEAAKTRKGANRGRIDDKIRAAALDQQRRLQDLDRKYQVSVEVSLVQMAVVSYPKVAVPLMVQQGKELRPGMAVWDPLVHEGYFHFLRLDSESRGTESERFEQELERRAPARAG